MMIQEVCELLRRRVIILAATRQRAMQWLEAYGFEEHWNPSTGRAVFEGGTIVWVAPDHAERVRGLNADMVIVQSGACGSTLLANLRHACRQGTSTLYYI